VQAKIPLGFEVQQHRFAIQNSHQYMRWRSSAVRKRHHQPTSEESTALSPRRTGGPHRTHSTGDCRTSPRLRAPRPVSLSGLLEYPGRFSSRRRQAISFLVLETAITVESLEKMFPPARSGWRTFFQPFEKPSSVALAGVSFEVREGE